MHLVKTSFLGPAAIFAALSLAVSAAAQPSPPNVVLIFVDDLGYGELGCQGNPEIPTPHIDSIAAQGIRCTDGYVTAPYCSASRAGIMTGRYQTRFGYEFNPIGAHNEDPQAGLPPSERTLANQLHDAGYTTALIGKWHLGGTAAYHPLRRGFDEFFGFLHEGHFFIPPPYRGTTTMLRRRTLPGGRKGRWIGENLIYSTHMGHDEPPYDADNPIYRGGQPIQETSYLTEALTREAVDFIRRQADKPFFLYLSYNAVHSPLQALNSDLARCDDITDIHRRIFAGMLVSLDDGIGQVLETLRETGLESNTLLFFISDNGGPTKELTSSNLPLRGGKGDLYEGGIRVPFLVKWPAQLPAGKIYRDAVVSLDVFATASAAAAAPIRRERPMDGVNLIPYLRGQADGKPHDVLFWRLQRKAALRSGDWKLVRNPRGGSDANWQLYNLAQDIGEARDLADQMPERRTSLVAAWERMNAQMIEPIWRPGR
jgi:arylsulfatase B